MQKKIFILLLLISNVLLCGCNINKDDDKLTIYTSFYPLYDFTLRIVGNNANVTNLVPTGMEPHDYEPTALDIENLYKADLIIVNGLGLETFLGSFTDELLEKVFISTEGIETINVNNATDPHVWLDVSRATKQMENIKDKIMEIDPDNSELYQNNYDKHYILFSSIDERIEKELKVFVNPTIVCAHQAFGYFANRYQITQIAINGLSTEEEPSSTKIAEIINYVKEYNVSTIFYEELVSSRIAELIAAETNSKVDVLNPLEGLSESKSNDDYITIMIENLMAIKRALE